MWTEGYHCKPPEKWADTNNKLKEIKGELTTREAQIAFARFCKANPSFSAQLLMGVDLYPFQDLFIRAMFQRDFFLGVCSRGLGKTTLAGIFIPLYAIFNPGIRIGITSITFRQCLVEGSLVQTKEGLVPIEDLKVGDLVLSKNKEYNKIKDHWKNEQSELVSIKDNYGREIIGKPEHKILVFENFDFVYKKLKDLKNGDNIINYYDSFENNNDAQWSSDELYLAGQLLGDGCCSVEGRYTLSTDDFETQEFVKSFGFTKVKKRNQFYINPNELNIKSIVCQKTATNKYIPKKIFQCSKGQISEFLKGLFDADGYASETEIALSTSSYQLAQQVQVILWSLGILCRVSTEPEKGEMEICGNKCFGNESYKVRITSRFYARKFMEVVGFRLDRKKLAGWSFVGGCKNIKDSVIFKDLIRPLKNKYKGKHTSLNKGSGRTQRNSITKDGLLELLERVKNIDDEDKRILEFFAFNDVFYSQVKDKKSSFGVTYDLTVDNDPSYVANCSVHHNSRAIFEAIESFAEMKEGHFLKQCIIGKPSHKNDAWEMSIGVPGGKKSKIVAVPLGAGEKIRGYRFNLLVIDEMLLISEKIINEVLQPFMAIQSDPRARQKVREAEDKLIAAGKITEEDRTQFESNKLIGLTSASYEFEYLYQLYCDYSNIISDKNAKNVNHAIFQMSYLSAPKGLYDETVVDNALRTYSKAQFDREYMAHFTGDSSGFFSAKKLSEVSLQVGDSPHVLIEGRPNKKYILAVDPNYDDSETSDHFAMCLLEIDHDMQSGVLVHAYALAKSDLKSRALYIKYLFDHFDIIYMIVDNAGGSKFVKDVNTLGVLDFQLGFFEADFDKSDQAKIEEAKKTYKPAGGTIRNIVHAQVFNTNWNRLANESLQANIDRKKIWFASPVDPDNVRKPDTIKIEDLEFCYEEYKDTREQKQLKMNDFIEHQTYMVSLTKEEMCLIEASTNASGTMRFDLPPELAKQNGVNRPRKDSYTVMLLANWGLDCYFLLLQTPDKKVSRVKPKFLA